MAPSKTDQDQPLTPAGRLFLQPETNQIIHCSTGLKHPIDVDAVKSEISNCLMVKHPRFTSLLLKDPNGQQYWRKIDIDIDQHVFVVHLEAPYSSDPEIAVNYYIADLCVTPELSFDKPLWEIHLLLPQKCVVWRIHHALGDGISLMSLFLACFRKIEGEDAVAGMYRPNRYKILEWSDKDLWTMVSDFVKIVVFSLWFILEFILRFLFVNDRKTAITGGKGVELWPRKIATAGFWLEDLKVVKRAVGNATINDVIFGVISAGLSRYLDHRANGPMKAVRLTGLGMVNLRPIPEILDVSKLMETGSGSHWGNKFGMFLIPIDCLKDVHDPLDHVRRAKTIIDRKKKSLEAHFCYKAGDLAMSLFGAKVASLLNYRVLCQTTFTLSNLAGPQEEITFAGNKITYIRAVTSSLPHALTMYLVSYLGKAEMQIVVAKDIIPDPEFLGKCFEDALLEMKDSAIAKSEL